MAQTVSNPIRTFASDERGTIAIIFSLCIFVLFSIIGLALDIGRLYHISGKIASASDAAVLAAAKSLRLANLSDADVKKVAEQYFTSDMAGAGSDYATIDSISVNIDRAKGSVGIDVAASVSTTFARVAGVTAFNLPKSSVAIFDSKDLEVSLQLDMTGSMSGQKIVDLKAATKNLLDVLMPDSPTGQKVRVGFAPFSAGVNVGPYLKAVDGNRSAPNTCTYERRTAANEKTDAPPLGTSDSFKIRTDLTGNVQACPNAQLVPLTEDKGYLKGTVNTFNANASTAGQLGASWAWYLLSPNWSTVWPASSTPAAYNDGRTIKTVILMTDGVYNTIGGVQSLDDSVQAVQASNLSVDICSNMKGKGIVVYTVGFDVNHAGSQKQRVIDTLTACASDPTKFFRAEDGAALDAAFRQIAQDIVSLRLSK